MHPQRQLQWSIVTQQTQGCPSHCRNAGQVVRVPTEQLAASAHGQRYSAGTSAVSSFTVFRQSSFTIEACAAFKPAGLRQSSP